MVPRQKAQHSMDETKEITGKVINSMINSIFLQYISRTLQT